MANTDAQRRASETIRADFLPNRFGMPFAHEAVELRSGGKYKCDAVSEDGQIVVSICTSMARTSGGKLGVGKMTKVRADMYFLLLAKANRRVVVFTETDMYDQWIKESERGRVDSHIELMFAEVDPETRKSLSEAREAASREVRPRRSGK